MTEDALPYPQIQDEPSRWQRIVTWVIEMAKTDLTAETPRPPHLAQERFTMAQHAMWHARRLKGKSPEEIVTIMQNMAITLDVDQWVTVTLPEDLRTRQLTPIT